jgi:DNA repair exonuclease SbcCD ATPase subunit
MKLAQLDNQCSGSAAAQPENARSSERQLTVDQLARAVGEHALRQIEIDQRVASRVLELRAELNATKDEIRSLRAQVEQLVQGLSQGLGLARSQSANMTQRAFQASASSLRNS